MTAPAPLPPANEPADHRQDDPPGRCRLCWQPWPCATSRDGSDPAALTDEELAALEAFCGPEQVGPCSCVLADTPQDCSVDVECFSHSGSKVRRVFLEEQHRHSCLAVRDVPRLIAALRASRAEVKRLREWLISEGYNLDGEPHLP